MGLDMIVGIFAVVYKVEIGLEWFFAEAEREDGKQNNANLSWHVFINSSGKGKAK